MKVTREQKEFTPVLITIESQDELNYLYAALNASYSEVKQNGKYILREDVKEDCQMPMYEAIDALYGEDK